MNAFLQRQPFSILGAIGLLTLVDGLINLPAYVGQWIDAWQNVTRPIWEFIIGWAFSLFDYQMPWFVSDHLTMSAIIFGASIRAAFFYDKKFDKESLIISLIIAILWPIGFVVVTAIAIYENLVKSQRDEIYARSFSVFYESFVYAAIVMALAYGTMNW